MATAKSQYITTKYGTKINVTGLTPDQISKVRSTAEDRGAYGTKGAALASQFQKQNTKITPTKQIPPGQTTGTAVPGVPAVAAQPGMTGATGGTGTNPAGTGQTPASAFGGAVNPNDPTYKAPGFDVNSYTPNLSGMPTLPGGGDVVADAAKNRDAAYAYLTKDNAQNKSRELAAAKQELAQRGIPLDPSPDSLYGRTLQQIENKYQGLDDQAKQQSFSMGQTALSTEADVQKSAVDSFLTGAGLVSDAQLKALGIDEQTIIALRQIQASKDNQKTAADATIKAAKIRNTSSGGGTDTSPIISTGAAP